MNVHISANAAKVPNAESPASPTQVGDQSDAAGTPQMRKVVGNTCGRRRPFASWTSGAACISTWSSGRSIHSSHLPARSP